MELTHFVTGFSTFILKVSAENLKNYQIETILLQLKWSQEQVTKLLKVYTANQTKIQMKLQLYGKHPPKVIDVDWRLDHAVQVLNITTRECFCSVF